MKIILYEYASGGGYAGQQLPIGILAEGFGMLRSVVTDCKANGHEVTILLDARLSNLNPPIDADYTFPVMHPEEPEKLLTGLAKIKRFNLHYSARNRSKIAKTCGTCRKNGQNNT